LTWGGVDHEQPRGEKGPKKGIKNWYRIHPKRRKQKLVQNERRRDWTRANGSAMEMGGGGEKRNKNLLPLLPLSF